MAEQLTKKKVTLFSKASKDVKELYLSAFPKVERFPYIPLLLNAYRRDIEFTSYYDDEKFVGLSYIVFSKHFVFLLFLAVNPLHRNQSYGSRLLNTIKASSKGRPVVLAIEEMDETASNYQQRLNRLAFYEKNDYHMIPHFYYEMGEKYQLLATEKTVDMGEFKKMLRKISYGIIPIDID
ncbi:GNAT family N-acetyltransferase [Streptococcus pacificus]|uniref:GNAT family N-acetyltransferase n=1 Tax=Streptococcus pacificus TaxID=2740577 RepID=A0ABS0ZHG8_9STRE|nr:GNAT family N-acetyltransferase [Streptococcus pacificus]MBJ8325425.1 GNAT family N-acetyltransferase [Streptococcus pacificus]